jgi:NDP-sugar pyrophosphorylase family protein
VNRAVILHNSRVGRGAVVANAILDKGVVVADGAMVGVDKEHDKARGSRYPAAASPQSLKGSRWCSSGHDRHRRHRGRAVLDDIGASRLAGKVGDRCGGPVRIV